jgi:hypothetical protein
MDFFDSKHELAELVFHGATELEPGQICRQEVLDALDSWRRRPDHVSPGVDLLRVVNCTLFSINYAGQSGDYWPTEADNDVSETLIREFLYPEGICTLTDEHAHLIRMTYSIMALSGVEYLLVCPYLTDAGNISGIVVVCVTKMIHH